MFVSRIFTSRRSVRGAVEYTAFKSGARLIQSTILDVNKTPLTQLDALTEYFQSHQKSFGKNSIGHMYISSTDPSIDSEDKWVQLVDRAVEELNHSHAPRITGLHEDTETPHTHLLMGFFRIEYCLGEEAFEEEQYKPKSNKDFLIKYKEKTEELEKISFRVARKIEEEFNLQRDSLNVHVGKDRYIKNEYSIKFHLKEAIEATVKAVNTVEDFLKKLPVVATTKLKELVERVVSNGRKAAIGLIGMNPIVKIEVKINPSQKNVKRYIQFNINGWKIRDFKIDPSLSLQNLIRKISILKNSTHDSASRLGSSLKKGYLKAVGAVIVDVKPKDDSSGSFKINGPSTGLSLMQKSNNLPDSSRKESNQCIRSDIQAEAQREKQKNWELQLYLDYCHLEYRKQEKSRKNEYRIEVIREINESEEKRQLRRGRGLSLG